MVRGSLVGISNWNIQVCFQNIFINVNQFSHFSFISSTLFTV